jgi:hypothetical protein
VERRRAPTSGSGRRPHASVLGDKRSSPSPWALDLPTSGTRVHRRPCGHREVGSPQPLAWGGDGEDEKGEEDEDGRTEEGQVWLSKFACFEQVDTHKTSFSKKKRSQEKVKKKWEDKKASSILFGKISSRLPIFFLEMSESVMSKC